MKSFKNMWSFALAIGLIAVTLAYAGDRIVRYTYQGGQIFDLRSDGLVQSVPDKRANNSTVTSATLPTTTTGSQFAMTWLPVFNVGAAVTQGDILISSNTGTAFVAKGPASSALTNIVGVAAEAIASGATGWMVPRGGGYAVVHTTGTVAIGDLLVSTVATSGYLATNNSPVTGSAVATAMSAGTAAGGNTLVIMH